jgi:GNAT superfamily N-acetyltransferase
MQIYRLSFEDFLDIRILEEAELDKNSESNHYTYDSAEFYSSQLFDNKGSVFGVYDGDKLVAISGNFLLGSDDEHRDFFKDSLLNNKIESNPDNIVFFNNTLVSKAYRGKGLQKKFREHAIKYYNKMGITEFISTTSLDNEASAKSLINLGMKELSNLQGTPYSKSTKRFFYLKSIS